MVFAGCNGVYLGLIRAVVIALVIHLGTHLKSCQGSEKRIIKGILNIIAQSFKYCRSLFQRRQWHPTPALLPGKSHGLRSLVGCSPWGREESDTTERLHFHFSLSCIGEGNGNPLQCSCLENPRNGGAWWAAVYGVAQSRTRLKRISSSSNDGKIKRKIQTKANKDSKRKIDCSVIFLISKGENR